MSLNRISIDPSRMGGMACIRNSRITVTAVLGQLAAEHSIEQILADYPDLERADIVAALEYAAVMAAEREIPVARVA